MKSDKRTWQQSVIETKECMLHRIRARLKLIGTGKPVGI